MVGVDVRLDRQCQRQTKLTDRIEVPLHGFEHGVDKRRFAGLLAANQIRVSRRDRLEQLTEDHRWPLARWRHRSASAMP